MNQVVRNKTFETNSSTSHNMVIIPDEYYEDWNNNKLWYMRYTWGDENKKLLEENNGSRLFTEEFLKSHGVFTDEPDIDDYESEDEYEEAYNDWESLMEDFMNSDKWDNQDLEGDEEVYTTKSGDKIHILCAYGYE